MLDEYKGKYITLKKVNQLNENDMRVFYNYTNGSSITLGDKTVDSYDPDELIWIWIPIRPNTFEEFKQIFVDALNTPRWTLYLVYKENVPIGTVSLLNDYQEHRRVEIGMVFYSPVAQRTFANLEACYLLMNDAYQMGYNRIEWKCHSQNKRSRLSALKMGFTIEGILDKHMIVRGESRDTYCFRLLRDEWENRASLRLKNKIY